MNVALNVVDAKGFPVGGLGREDFEIFEDGKAQKIAVFEREATTPLSIVLAIDASESVMTSERLEKEAAKHFVNALLREQDELDLMEFSDVVREVVPFTNQKKRIETGLTRCSRERLRRCMTRSIWRRIGWRGPRLRTGGGGWWC